jgi:signal transduction histidine kinase
MELAIDRTKWFFHPIFVFIFSIIALVLSLILYIYWYVEVSSGLRELVAYHNLDSGQFLESETWVVILILSILVGIILIGIFTIFVYNQKTLKVFRLQHSFIKNFTHELKTPVTSMKLYLETFLKHDLSRDDQIKYIRYMLQDAERLSENINRILNLARIESKTYGKEFVTLDLVATVERFCKTNSQLFRDTEITIRNQMNRPLFCQINLPLFEMLIMNLLTNAIKYNQAETPKIDIIFKRHRRKLCVCFEDNGIGIEKAEIKKIFKKFYQSGRTDDMSAKGIGLGLHLVKNIARIHKGKVVASSNGIGKGSVFSLFLPVRTS